MEQNIDRSIQPQGQNSTETNEKIGFANLSGLDWLKISAVILAAGFLLYRCFLPFRAEYTYREAYNFEASGNPDAAIAKYEKTIRLAPWETHYFVQLGKLYEDKARAAKTKEERLGWTKKAEYIYDRCLAISPTNPWYVNRKGEIFGLLASVTDDPVEQRKLMAKREQYVLEAANLDKNNALFQMAVAYLYHQRGELDKALQKYQHVLEIDERFGEAYFNMADIYRQKKQPAKQMEMYQTLIAKNPGFKNAHLQLGRIYESQGKMTDAINQYIEEVNLDKNNEVALQVLGVALYRVGDWANVSKVYHRLSIIKPDNVRYYLFHAQAAAKIGNLAEALEALEAAQVLQPGDAQIAQNIRGIKNILNPPAKSAVPLQAAPGPVQQ